MYVPIWKNHKRYIKIRPAIDFIEQNLMVSETALLEEVYR